MLRESIVEDIDNMEEIRGALVYPTDIWQDRYIYWMALAIWHILQYIVRREKW